jgi:hypothetical protein
VLLVTSLNTTGGSDVRVRLEKCASYFQLNVVPPDFRVRAVSLHMVSVL